MGEGEGAGDEGLVPRVVLAFHPERPDPVQVVLDRPGVQKAPGVEHHARAQKLEGFLHLERLGEALEACEKFHRVHQAPGPCRAAHQLLPGEPPQPHGEPFLPWTGGFLMRETDRIFPV